MRRLPHRKALTTNQPRLPQCRPLRQPRSCRRCCVGTFSALHLPIGISRQAAGGNVSPEPYSSLWRKDFRVNKEHRGMVQGGWYWSAAPSGTEVSCIAPHGGGNLLLQMSAELSRGTQGEANLSPQAAPPVQRKRFILMFPSSFWCSAGPRCCWSTAWAEVQSQEEAVDLHILGLHHSVSQKG